MKANCEKVAKAVRSLFPLTRWCQTTNFARFRLSLKPEISASSPKTEQPEEAANEVSKRSVEENFSYDGKL